jgi:hypothetical protein
MSFFDIGSASVGGFFFLSGEGPHSRRYGRIAAVRLIVQPCDEDDDAYYYYFLCFS